MVRRSSPLLGTLFLISWASCSRERARPPFDPDLALLDIAKTVCAAPRSTLRAYLTDRGHHTAWLRDMGVGPDTLWARLDSTLADATRRGLLFDDSVLVGKLATENLAARYGWVSTQRLPPDAPFPTVGWVDLFFGPVRVDSTTWGRRHPGEPLFFNLRIFLVSTSSGWLVEAPHYDGSWFSPRRAGLRDLIRSIEQGRGCEAIRTSEHGS